MSFKRLMFLTSSLATASLAVVPQTAEANGVTHAGTSHTGTWGKPFSAGLGGNGLDCDLQMPRVQHPQTVGPVAVPPVGNNFGVRSSGGFTVARPQGFQGNASVQGNDGGSRPGLFNGGLNVQRPTGVNGGNVNSGAVNAYRPNSSSLNVVRPGAVEGVGDAVNGGNAGQNT